MRFGTVLVGLLFVGAAVAQDIPAPEGMLIRRVSPGSSACNTLLCDHFSRFAAAPALAPLSALTHDLGAALAPTLTKRKILALSFAGFL